MGSLSSTPSTTKTNPDSTTMSSSISPQSPIQESSDRQLDTNTLQAPVEKPNDGEEEEDGECGFCVFMKGGDCRDAFIDWEKCVEEGEKNNEDIAERCFQVTSALTKCMQANSEYYAPILQAEKAAKVEAVKELEKEKERLDAKGEVLDGSQQEKES